MARNATNELLQKAKKSKSDEFYTQMCDIDRELQHYGEQFRGKSIYCNCDDPRVSNFYQYFVIKFKELGLRRVIASCYLENGKGFYYTYAGEEGQSKIPTLDNVVFFNGDGDFRSEESVELLKQSDVVVTNPPFSLFRDYVSQIINYDKEFLIIGNVNAITYKEIFKLIQNNQAWLGINLGRGISGFIVPEHYDLYGTETRIDENGDRIVSSNSCLWLTNLETKIRNEDINLTKTYKGNEDKYPKYDNYDGINVSKTQEIPMDYKGYMGVPITFLHKFNPDQFEIIHFRKGNNGKDLSINGKCTYFRIIIRNIRQ